MTAVFSTHNEITHTRIAVSNRTLASKSLSCAAICAMLCCVDWYILVGRSIRFKYEERTGHLLNELYVTGIGAYPSSVMGPSY